MQWPFTVIMAIQLKVINPFGEDVLPAVSKSN